MIIIFALLLKNKRQSLTLTVAFVEGFVKPSKNLAEFHFALNVKEFLEKNPER